MFVRQHLFAFQAIIIGKDTMNQAHSWWNFPQRGFNHRWIQYSTFLLFLCNDDSWKIEFFVLVWQDCSLQGSTHQKISHLIPANQCGALLFLMKLHILIAQLIEYLCWVATWVSNVRLVSLIKPAAFVHYTILLPSEAIKERCAGWE